MLSDSKDIVRRLLDCGFIFVSQRGSHRKSLHPENRRMVIVPHPRRDLPPGTVRSIYKQAGWIRD